MFRGIQRWHVSIAVLTFVLCPFGAQGQNKDWTWADKDHKTRKREDLEQILSKHLLWLASAGARGERADLGGATLNGANLSDANLGDACLRDALLTGVELYNAKLNGADLRGARLVYADATAAHLDRADLRYSQLEGTDFDHADLRGTIFEPRSVPDTRLIESAQHLELLTYYDDTNALSQLRRQFQEGMFRAQERKITYALNRRQAELDGPIEKWFKTLVFDWTCQYGMNPGRALRIWFGIFLLCCVGYALFIHHPGNSGIYRIQKKVGETGQEESVEEQIRPGPISPQERWPRPLCYIWRERRVLFWAAFFSLMSAFNIGFRDINFGRWLRLLPRTEYDLKAKGWARTVAGFQSLISVYLIALWVLTYFGRPFE